MPSIWKARTRPTGSPSIVRTGLLSCEHATSMLVRYEDGQRSVLASHHDGLELNSPNDVIVHSCGAVYFTDPPYGRGDTPHGIGRAQALDFQGVFRLDPDGDASPACRRFRQAERALLRRRPSAASTSTTPSACTSVASTVSADGSLGGGDVFFVQDGDSRPGVPDGMKLDVLGNIWVCGPGGIWIVSPSAEKLGVIAVPEVAANLAWGEDDMRSLYRHRQYGPVPDPDTRCGRSPSIPSGGGDDRPRGRDRGCRRRQPGDRRGDRADPRSGRCAGGGHSRDGATPSTLAASLGEGHVGLALDVRSTESVDAAAASVLESLGTPSILVNNAGINHIGPAEVVHRRGVGRGPRRQPHGRLPLLPRVRQDRCSPRAGARSSTSRR